MCHTFARASKFPENSRRTSAVNVSNARKISLVRAVINQADSALRIGVDR